MRRFLITAIAALALLTCKAQSNLNDFSFHILYKTTSTDTLVFDSLCNRICEVVIPDTSGISSIHVKVGSTDGGNEILLHTFIFDQSIGLTQGLSWTRVGKTVRLGLLQTYKADLYYYEVWLEDLQGNLSLIRKWN